jgi:hypothetical protein
MGKSGEESVNHYSHTRMRINGSGEIKTRFLSLDEIRDNVMVPIAMADPSNIEPLRLGNFTEQRCSLELKTTTIDYVFHCSKIIIFAKKTATSYPGN